MAQCNFIFNPIIIFNCSIVTKELFMFNVSDGRPTEGSLFLHTNRQSFHKNLQNDKLLFKKRKKHNMQLTLCEGHWFQKLHDWLSSVVQYDILDVIKFESWSTAH